MDTTTWSAGPFAPAVTEEEWREVPAEIGKKLQSFVEGRFDELLTTKALLETYKFNTEQNLSELKGQYEIAIKERNELQIKFDASNKTIVELENQVSAAVGEVAKLQTTCSKLEAETAQFRNQRDVVIDERDSLQRMVERRDGELERLHDEMELLKNQLEAAISAKCQALAQADEVASMKLTIEYKEKRLDQERSLLSKQMESLNQDLHQKTEELLNLRRDNSLRCIQLETKLTEKMQELSNANNQIKALMEMNSKLEQKTEELSTKLAQQQELYAKTTASFNNELQAQTKLTELHKNNCEEHAEHIKKLTVAIEELQENLKIASEKYGDLETEHKEEVLRNQELLEKKDECIALLKKELDVANDLLEGSRHETLSKQIEDLSPGAAAAANLLKSGMSLTGIYNKYVEVAEELATQKAESARVKAYLAEIVEELEAKGPYLRKQREELENALETISELVKKNDELVIETQELRETVSQCKRLEGIATRENERLKKELADLGRQVCHLLREIEQLRNGSPSTSIDQDMSDSVSSADIITKRLVTFSDVAELQSNNQRLLALVRELSERQEEAESYDPIVIAKLKTEIDTLREQQRDNLDQLEKQNKMMATVMNQRDMYKTLYSQAVKGSKSDSSMEDQDGVASSKATQGSGEDRDEKLQELESQVQKYRKDFEFLKEENETYRKEKSDNEKILLEQVDSLRKENTELVRTNGKLSIQVSTFDEKCKKLVKEIEFQKTRVEALEKNNRLHTETIIKHEQTVMYLKDEILQAHTKLSRAEVALSNIQKENALLKDAEQRLLKEREINRQEAHTQNLIHTNIELIKATLERNDAENKIRLESRLDDAHRECAALRRRLQEEQDNFRELSEHLKKQAELAHQRMEEEKQQAEKLRSEIVELREDLVNKSAHIEDLTKKLKSSILTLPDCDGDGRKFREMEQLLSQSQAECEMLKEKLKIAKEMAEQHSNVAENAEKQLKEVFDLKQAAEAKIKEQEEVIAKLQEQNSELQGELSVQNDGQESASTDLKTKIYRLEQELRHAKEDLKETTMALEAAKNEIKTLTTNVEEAENKYSREMLLHSNDLQQLSAVKEELTKALNDINEVKNERDRVVAAMQQNQSSWALQEDLFKKEKEELIERFKNMEAQNALLLDQIQALNTQLSVIQAQASTSANSSMGDSSFNRSLVEDEVKSSDQLLKIIKYLRQEKDIAVSKCEILEAEQQRLKTEHDALQKQFEEAKNALDAERQKSEVSVVTAAKHAEILRKVETLNAITDSNRALRQERNSLITQVEQLKARIVTLEEKMAPLEEKNKELALKAEAMQTENISLRGEATRWRQRANFLIEKSNRTSPEDWKKLQNERETLAKQLTIERGNVAKLTDENNNLKQDKTKLEEQLKSLRMQNNTQAEEIAKLKDSVNSLQTQVSNLTQSLEQTKEGLNKLTEEHRVLSEEAASKEATITDLKNNLAQIRKIAKKYKTQCEDQLKEIETLKEQCDSLKATPENISEERQEQLREEGRSELQQRINELEETHKQKLDELSQQLASITGDNESCKKEIETLKQHNTEKEERFKTLFKNAKDKILTLTEQNNALREQMNNSGSGDKQGEGTSSSAAEVEKLQKEKAEILAEKQAEKDRLTMEIETLTQRINQLQRQLGHQQGSKPSTSSGTSEKASTEPPTANIKPMAGHSTNTQAQSVTVQPWRSGGEPPLASIRPMSMQVRTVAVLPTSQTPSAVMVPPQQQVHTTGSSSIEALSSSPTSSHTDYAPATSSASVSLLGPRQIAVPPTQSTADTEDEDTAIQVQQQQQQQPQQAVAHVLPRVEPPFSGFSQDQGTSSSSSNTVTTTQASLKRQRDSDADNGPADEQSKTQQAPKRTRVQPTGTEASQSVSESGLEVEYQVPTSSQRDHEEEVIVVESDEGEGPDEGEGVDDEADDPDTEGYDMELSYPHEQELNYEDADCQDEDDMEVGNEVEVIHDDSSEVPNQSERSIQGSSTSQVENIEQAQSEATSSGTDGSGGVTFSQASTSASVTMPSFSRTRPVAPLSRQQVHLLLPHGIEDGGDDGIVPSTPTLYVPRRSDGFGEAVSSPVVPTSGRFSFNESGTPSGTGSNEVIPEQTLEIANVDDNGTGRSVPTTPLRASPQEAGPSGEEQSSHQTPSEEIPAVAVSGASEEAESAAEGSSGACMGPPSTAATQPSEQSEDMLEGEDGVTSEGEKPVTAEESEEEGREAEASPSTNHRTRSQTGRGSHNVSRRVRTAHNMTRNMSRPSPTPIVWSEQRSTEQRPTEQRSTEQRSARHQQETAPSRGGMSRGNATPQHGYGQRTPRRSRGRQQRPYGRF